MPDRIMTMRAVALGIHVRWAIRSDIARMMAVERASFLAPHWTLRDYLTLWRDRSCVLLVAEEGASVVGFLIYRLVGSGVEVLSMAVRPEFRRRGVGSLLLAHSIRFDRDHVAATVGEENLEAQLFFRWLGFRAVAIRRNHTIIGDGYVMRRSL